jgi:hypothetical protein
MNFNGNKYSYPFTGSEFLNLGEIDIEETAIFTGHAKLPSGIALFESLKIVSCALIVHLKTGKVINASFTTLSPMTGSYISYLVIGWSFNDGIEKLSTRFDKHCHISSKKAFLKAVEVAGTKYRDFISLNIIE